MRVLTVSAVSRNSPAPTITDHFEALGDGFGVEFEHVYVHVDGPRPYPTALAELVSRARRRPRFDLVHAFYGHCGLLALAQRRLPTLVTFQGSDILGGRNGAMHGRDGMVGRAVSRRVDGVIVMSEEMASLVDRSDTHVIPFGVNTEIFRPGDRQAARARLGMDPSRPTVLFPYDPSRPEKHHDLVEAAVTRLRSDGLDADLRVVFARDRAEVAEAMTACDALAMASDHEGSPVAVREALACGLPVVSVDVGDVAVVLDGRPDCHVVDRDPSAMADALSQVLGSGRRTPAVVDDRSPDVGRSAAMIHDVYRRITGRSTGLGAAGRHPVSIQGSN